MNKFEQGKFYLIAGITVMYCGKSDFVDGQRVFLLSTGGFMIVETNTVEPSDDRFVSTNPVVGPQPKGDFVIS